MSIWCTHAQKKGNLRNSKYHVIIVVVAAKYRYLRLQGKQTKVVNIKSWGA